MTSNDLVLKISLILIFLTAILISILMANESKARVIEFRDITGGMFPAIPYNSTVNVDTNITQFHDLEVGDIIAFKTPSMSDGNKIIIHRISAIIEQGNNVTGELILCAPIPINEVIQTRTLLTKGDDNSCSLPGFDFPITVDEYVGKVVSVTSTRNM